MAAAEYSYGVISETSAAFLAILFLSLLYHFAESVSIPRFLLTIFPFSLRGRWGSCTCPLRINTAGSLTNRQKDKKVYARGLSWHPSGPLPPGDALEAGRVAARRLLRPPPLAASHHPACSHPCWLRPRRHAEEQHLAQGPHMVGQPRGHGWCLGLPPLGRAGAVGRFGVWQWQP